jgi:hypothetical protein
MDETTLRKLLGSALSGEPPIGPVAQNALRAGIKRRHRRALGTAGGLAAVAVVAVVAVIPTVFSPRGALPGQVTASGTSTSQQLNVAAATRRHAITWILQQVSRAALVGCDAQVCADLASRGFPSGNLLTLGPQSNDPRGSALVVATPTVRAQYGERLASVYAPAVIASFGSGNARIDIRLVSPGGAAEQRALRFRKAADAHLLSNRHITVSATAQAQLRSGDIDPRLPVLIAIMAAAHPVRIVDFGGWSPGGGPASLLRWVDLATVDPAANLTRAAYLSWMRAFINVQRASYHPRSQQVTQPTGQAVFRIEFLAPSPLR